MGRHAKLEAGGDERQGQLPRQDAVGRTGYNFEG
jgi:hypothetical protein